MGLNQPASLQTVVIYFEYLAQNNIRACSMRNHLSVLKHYFGLFNWPIVALTSRKVMLLIKSVQMNTKLRVTVKSVMSISLLEKMSKTLTKFQNGITYRALFLVAYFGFFDWLHWFQIRSRALIKQDTQCLGILFGVPLAFI